MNPIRILIAPVTPHFVEEWILKRKFGSMIIPKMPNNIMTNPIIIKK